MNQEKLVMHVKNQIIKHVRAEDGEFTIKDLFDGITWKRLSIRDRSSLGVRILNEARYGVFQDLIEVLQKKNSANMQLYKKEK